MKKIASKISLSSCLIISLGAFTACGEKDDEVALTKASSDLAGSWSLCQDSSDDDSEEKSYSKSLYVFSDNSLTVTDSEHSKADCSDSPTFKFSIAAEIAGGENFTDVTGAKTLDVTIGLATVTLLTDEYVTNFNEGKFCGISDWKKNTVTSINGKTCGEDGKPIGALGTKDYDIYKIEGNKVFFGDESTEKDGLTEAKRYNKFGEDGYTKS